MGDPRAALAADRGQIDVKEAGEDFLARFEKRLPAGVARKLIDWYVKDLA